MCLGSVMAAGSHDRGRCGVVGGYGGDVSDRGEHPRGERHVRQPVAYSFPRACCVGPVRSCVPRGRGLVDRNDDLRSVDRRAREVAANAQAVSPQGTDGVSALDDQHASAEREGIDDVIGRGDDEVGRRTFRRRDDSRGCQAVAPAVERAEDDRGSRSGGEQEPRVDAVEAHRPSERPWMPPAPVQTPASRRRKIRAASPGAVAAAAAFARVLSGMS